MDVHSKGALIHDLAGILITDIRQQIWPILIPDPIDIYSALNIFT